MFDPEYSRYDSAEPDPDPRAKSLAQWLREPGVAREFAEDLLIITQESVSDLWKEMQGSRRLTRSALFLVLAGSAAGTSTCRVDEGMAQHKEAPAPSQDDLPTPVHAAQGAYSQKLQMSLEETQCREELR